MVKYQLIMKKVCMSEPVKAILLGLVLVPAALAGVAGPVEVRVRQTDGGPRIFVDGKAVRPRFYYGSPACLCNISSVEKRVFEIPFRAEADTDQGQLAMDGYAGDDPMWFSNLRLVDMESGVTNVITGVEEERTQHYRKGGIRFRKGRLYRFLITHRATHFRTYFTDEVSYLASDGRKVVLPLPYGDTLDDTAALAAEAGVDLVTFSTDSSWGCEGWWGEKDGEENYRKLDLACERLIRANPRVLFVPRVKADAPEWLLAQRPELRMRFANGMTVKMSSVSSRFYRREACRQVEMLTRHLRAKFPRNFAGLHVSGQNSAEWFYMMSQSKDASGYDAATRDAFRAWLAARGEPDAAAAEVPGDAERRAGDANGLRDPVKDRRALLFHRFRQEEMASLLSEIGAAIRRGSDGKVLSLFFYGYAWELGAVTLGAPETGHYGLEWLLENGKGNVDGISAPISYSNRRWPGTAPVMSAAESIQRAGILWINEDDNRTHHEDIWDHMGWAPHHDPWQTRNNFLRDSAVQILRGYGDWWMDLFGRGWFRDREVWDVRRALNPLDDAMLGRTRPYTPEIAVCVNEESFLYCAADSHRVTGPALNRRGFEACGVTYGQYLLNDVLADPPPAKVFYLAVANNLTDGQRAKLAALKASRPDAVFVENVRAADVTPEAIAATAVRAGAHAYARPGDAYVTAAEGYVSVFARTEGPLEIDFGTTGEVSDFLTGAAVGAGPKLTLPFRKGETRIFRFRPAGRNLLTNPDMSRADGMGDRAGWSGAAHRNVVESRVTARPLGDGAFELVFEGPQGLTYRQNMLTLLPGGRYRLSAEIRTAPVKGASARFRLWANGGSEMRFGPAFPADTKGEWQAVEFVTDAPPASKVREYYFAIVGNGSRSEPLRLEVRNLRLEALTDEAEAASAPIPAQFAERHELRIVPIDPLLDRVCAKTGRMTFYWPGEPNCGVTACRLVAKADGGSARTAALGADGRATVSFGALRPGPHRVEVEVRDPSDRVVSKYAYRITAVGPAPKGPEGRRLNNFVTELVDAPLKDGDVPFFRAADGWVWISFEGDCGDARGRLDASEEDVVRRREGETRLETQRFVSAGNHVLHVRGAAGGRVRIHAVKPIVGTAFAVADRKVNLNGGFAYNASFARRFDGLGVFNSFLGGGGTLFDGTRPDGAFYRARGAHCFGHGGGANAWNTNRYTRAAMYGCIANAVWRGGADVFIDENSVDVVGVWGHNVERACSINFSEAVWRMNEERPDAAVNTYFSDSNYGSWFRDGKCKTSEIACTVNTGRGRGWVVPESYAPTFSREADSARWEDYFAKFFASTTDLVPAARGNILPWMATYIGIGFWTSYVQPDADIKRHYSRLIRAFATRTEFADIAGLGFGGLGCGEDGITRWAWRIIRHYCLEGRTDDLADRYGFAWNPGVVRNADFAEGLADWSAEPAEGGSVVAETIADYGRQQGRQNRPRGVGDGVAVFTSSAAGANRLVQTLTGLEPGKYYSVQFCVADYGSIRENAAKRPPAAFSAAVEGATEVKELAYRQESKGTWACPIMPFFGNYRIVFRADAPTAKLVFSDRTADGKALPAGTRQALNYVIFQPYYLETPGQIDEILGWVRGDSI